MPRFHVRETLALPDKSAFVLIGFVLEGEITAGMSVSLPFNAHVKMTAKIDRLEFVHRRDGEMVCLCLQCAVPAEVSLWEALQVKNRMIDVISVT